MRFLSRDQEFDVSQKSKLMFRKH
jgi:hypothetical protein